MTLSDTNEKDALARVMQRIPETRAALARIPGVAAALRRASGNPAQVWDPDDGTDLTNKILCAGLQTEIEQLEARFETIEEKFEVVTAAERSWRPMLQARSHVVFRNDAGDVAKMPVDLVEVIATAGTLDGDIAERGRNVVFTHADEEIAEIPKELFVVLERILESSRWNTGRG